MSKPVNNVYKSLFELKWQNMPEARSQMFPTSYAIFLSESFLMAFETNSTYINGFVNKHSLPICWDQKWADIPRK